MNYNPNAFQSFYDKKYKNGYGQNDNTLTYDYVKNIENKINMDSIKTIFEIGSRDASQGLELSDWFTQAEIYCFEPVPSSAEWCIENCKLCNRMKFYQLALSEVNGEVDFFITTNNIGASSLYQANQNNAYGSHFEQYKTTVKSQTAQSFIEQHNLKVDLLWMDVQGSELTVLNSFGRYLEDDVQAIHTEVGLSEIYENSTLKDQLIEYMQNKNFELIKCLTNPVGQEEDLIFVNKKYIIQ